MSIAGSRNLIEENVPFRVEERFPIGKKVRIKAGVLASKCGIVFKRGSKTCLCRVNELLGGVLVESLTMWLNRMRQVPVSIAIARIIPVPLGSAKGVALPHHTQGCAYSNPCNPPRRVAANIQSDTLVGKMSASSSQGIDGLKR